ncbi:MAG: FAD-binding oxidoreductase, partial [Patescibacteria group bacterium]
RIEELKKKITEIVKGEVLDDEATLKTYSKDASLFKVAPQLVVWPKDKEDIKKVVKFVSENKHDNPELSVTVRAAGSCMSGGSLNESIILDVTKHMNSFGVDALKREATIEPGVFYKDFEVETLKHNLILPCYTASKNLCALGGMIGNNAAGEKTLHYGKMEDYILELNVILNDGEEYVFNAIPRAEALRKSHEHTKEGEIYQYLMALIDKNRELITNSKPKVSKNSSGYYLWNVERSGLFDITRLLVGSQGTLGIVVQTKIKLMPVPKKSKLLVVFLNELSELGEIINVMLKKNPESIESYDDATMKLAVRFFPEMIKMMKARNLIKLAWAFLPEVWMVLTGGLSKLILMVEFVGESENEIHKQTVELNEELRRFNLRTYITKNSSDAEKYWTIRRESFNLLRKHIKGRRTAPFIDDVCVKPEYLPQFLPRLRKLLDDTHIVYTIAGHAGNGNFHVIPLMDMKDEKNRQLITSLSESVYNLVAEYKGTITAEHNDGIVRTPYLSKIFSPEILSLFQQTKKIFDPDNIFNPGKKVNGTLEYLVEHLAKE